MRRRFFILLIGVCLLLSGCGLWMDGSYSSVKLHQINRQWQTQEVIEVSGYAQLISILGGIVEDGVQSATLSVGTMRRETLPERMRDAIRYTMKYNPVAAYAVSDILFQLGRRGGYEVAVVTVEYNSNLNNIKYMKRVRGVEAATQIITGAVSTCESGVLLLVDDYSPMDYDSIVRAHALNSPQIVMEQPKISVSEYPESGGVRVVELSFSYQTDKAALKDMQAYVEPVFTASSLYVSGALGEHVKYAQLYAFLTGRNQYTLESSITPSYSLLRYGVGDSRAFSAVYAAMCHDAGLECRVVSGTRRGEPWFWNIICENGVYYHLDVVESCRIGEYRKLADQDMVGYVWDYTAHPRCGT